MRTPFARPFFATFFYWYAGIGTALGVLICLGYPSFIRHLVGVDFGMLLEGLAGAMALAIVLQGIMTFAIGYCIELLAKIEWNTRPNTDDMGYAVAPTPAQSGPVMADKQYYVSDKGRLTGPLNAHEILALYRDGRISISAQVSVEESGQRRLLKNLSELSL